MSEFTYSPPNKDAYLKAILRALEKQGHTRLHKILSNALVSIDFGSTFSGSRWDAYYTEVYFEVPTAHYEEIDEEEEKILRSICDRLMPPRAGLDVMHVIVSASLYEDYKSLEQDLQQTTRSLEAATAEFTLPDDILNKGKAMAEVYLYLYAVENYIRLFIETVASKQYGDNYFGSLKIPNAIKRAITERKDAESKNTWMSIRGGSDLFYLDFKDLGDVILNNWELFKPYFPDQAWITAKINELGNCRNLVAHNSYLGELERDVIRTNFKIIIKQLNPHMK